MEAGDWLMDQEPGLQARIEREVALVVKQAETPVCLVRARAGKLVRVEVHDPKWRPLVDGLVKEFEKRGTWSFNGVVRTLE